VRSQAGKVAFAHRALADKQGRAAPSPLTAFS
jgi:hypothetical protein